MIALKMAVLFYLISTPIFAGYFLLKGFYGVIENPDEDDTAWMRERREHPVRHALTLLGLALIWPLYLVYLQRQYNKDIEA